MLTYNIFEGLYNIWVLRGWMMMLLWVATLLKSESRVSNSQGTRYVPNMYEYTMLSRLIIKHLYTPIWHQLSSLQANQESVSPDVPLSHGLS